MLLSEKTLPSVHLFKRKNNFTNKEGSDTCKKREDIHLNCNSDNIFGLITSKKMQKKLYLGRCITRFRTRFLNYRSCHRKFCKGHIVIKISFHAHFVLDEHCGVDDWESILIDNGRNNHETRKKSFLGNISLTFVRHGLNEPVVDLEWI